MSLNPRKILFIINPISGGKDKTQLTDLIKATLPSDFQYKVVYWDDPQMEFSKLINDNCDPDTAIIAAVGGDGTINKVADQLLFSDKILAIIPFGSGNGFARHISIPMNTRKALQLIETGKVVTIDACDINGKHYFTSAGIGFDAHISHLFSGYGKRGFLTYVKLVFSTFYRYQSKKYKLRIDGKKLKSKAFLITIANANQYGNNVFIAPEASLQDGLLDIVIMKRPNIFQSLALAFRLLNGTINKSPLITSVKAENIIIKRKNKEAVHYDGEHEVMKKKIHIRVLPGALKVLVTGSKNL